MSLAQDLRNAWDFRDRDEFERLLLQLPERQPDPSPHRHDVGQGMFGHSLPTYQQSGRPLGMVGTVGDQSEPGNQSNPPDGTSV